MSTQADRELFVELLRAGIEVVEVDGRLVLRGKGIKRPDLIERAKAHRDALLAMLRPNPDGIVGTALEIFGGTVEPVDSAEPVTEEPHDDLPDRLRMAENLLARKDAKGRFDYHRSEVDSMIIGLKHRASHPAVNAMLARLAEAKRKALTASMILARQRA